MTYFSHYIFIVAAMATFDSILTTEPDSKPAAFIQPCKIADLDCIKKSTEFFLSKTYKGIPGHDIVVLDPMVIPAVEVTSDSEGLRIEIKQITVKGMRNQKLQTFKMDEKAKTVKLSTATELSIEGETTQVSTNSSRVQGHFWAQANVAGTVSYNYTLVKDDKGVEHFSVSPETVNVMIVDKKLKVGYSPELTHALAKDSVTVERIDALSKELVVKIAEKAYASAVHNIRSAARLVPYTAFFKDLHNQ